MTANPYQVAGSSIARMLGRESLVKRIEAHWMKSVPDHVSVVGPAHYGKSVLLRHLADAHRVGSGCYLTTTYVDLRHGDARESDAAFKRRLAESVKGSLQPIHTELADWIDVEYPRVHEQLGDVFEQLEDDGARLLVVLDGFDHVLAGTGLTRTLWGQLRDLTQRSDSLRFLTGSRRPLQELCKTEESRTSDFWNIFHPQPVGVHALDDADWPAFLQPIRDGGCALDESARKEVVNWTGGVPVLVCALLHNLWEEHQLRGSRLSKPDVDRAAETMIDERTAFLKALWDDCDHELRSDLGALTGGDMAPSELSAGRRRGLEDRGFGRVSGNRMRGSCRFMQRYAEAQAPALADLNRVFGTVSGFETHVSSLLELRLAQVPRPAVAEDLCRFIGNAIRDITRRPQDALTWVRSISESALTLIWDAELPDRMIREEWLEEWKWQGDYSNDNDGKLPYESSAQCHLLRLLTRSDRTARCRHVTKTTCLLVDHLQSVGNFGSHLSNYPEATVTTGFAASVVFSAISLVECLSQDLSGVDTV